jgi:hypothetical protein
MNYKRECGNCTACCEGWLEGFVYGKELKKGIPCHFMCENGCSIYEDRPENPCRSYQCEWLINFDIPEWMKPNRSGIIVTTRYYGNNKKYLEVLETGKPIESNILLWFFIYHYTTQIPLKIQVNGGFHNFGPNEFIEFTSNQ